MKYNKYNDLLRNGSVHSRISEKNVSKWDLRSL